MASPLLTSLNGYWKLDEASGNASDSTANARTLTNTSASFTTGKLNNGASLGVNQYFARGDDSGIGNGHCSASMWIKPSSLPASDMSGYNNGNIFFAVSNTTTHVSFFFGLIREGGVQKVLINRQRQLAENGAISYVYTTSTSVFTHMAYTFDGTTLTLYINGSSVATYNVTGLSGTGGPTTNQTSVGGDAGDYDRNYAGVVDEVGLWSRALTSGEVSSLYNGGNGYAYPFADPVFTKNRLALGGVRRASSY